MDVFPMQSGARHLAHGWTLSSGSGVSGALVREFIRPAVRAIPSSMARRLGSCRIFLVEDTETAVTSRWTVSKRELQVSVTTTGCEDHDVAMELLLCLGQALWERLSETELRAYWMLLSNEIGNVIEGEIDERALEAKHALFDSRSHVKSARPLERYGGASFAGTAAEYVHCLWHEVSVRTGPDYLPAPALRRRLELMARWFPPDRGYRLFPAPRGHPGPSR